MRLPTSSLTASRQAALMPAYLCGILLLWPMQVLATASPALQFKTESPDGPSLGALSAFVLIFAVLLIAWLKLVRRRQGGKPPSQWMHWLPARQDNEALSILASKRVTPKVSLHVVDWEGGKLLLSVTDQQVVRLGEVKVAACPSQPENTQ